MGFRKRPDYAEVLHYIKEGEPLDFPLPNRKATIYTSSHFYLDDFPQSTEPLVENPRPHTDLGSAVENFYSADEDGYRGRPFPQIRRPSFLGPGQDTDTEDEAFRRNGFDAAPRPPPTASSSVSGRLGEAGLQGAETVIAGGAAGLAAAADRFAHRNAVRAADVLERRFLPPRAGPSPQIVGRPSEAEELIVRAGQRAQDVERAAAQDIEQFAAEQAAAEGGELVPLLAESAEIGTQTAAAAAAAEGGGGLLGGLAAFGGVAAEGAGTAAAVGFPVAEGLGLAAGVATGGAAALAGGVALGLYEGGRWLLGGNGGDAAPASSGSESADIRTINNMQQGAPQERFSVRQPRVRQPTVVSISSDDDAPLAQQREQPRPQVQSRPAPPLRTPFGLNQVVSSSESESYGPVRRRQPRAAAEPSFNELRREALSREPEAV